MLFKKQYEPRARVQPHIDPKTGRTHQSFKDDCDINNLIDRWRRTGIAEFTPRKAIYGDVSEFPDYHHSANLIAAADQQFALLSPEDQKKYGSPHGLVEAAYAASLAEANSQGTDDSLGVTVPSDTKPPKPSQKGDTDETQDDEEIDQQKAVYKNRPSNTQKKPS